MRLPETVFPSDLDRLAAEPGVLWVAFVTPTETIYRPEDSAEHIPRQFYSALLDLWDAYAVVNRTPRMLYLRFAHEELLILLAGALFLVLKLRSGANLSHIPQRASAALLRQKL
ncbi:MAG: hypothetical protein JO015_00110 [Verrucomicrobia bacterium]|nr:hypothetical protein [Verrucomicrobiota bacterium]